MAVDFDGSVVFTYITTKGLEAMWLSVVKFLFSWGFVLAFYGWLLFLVIRKPVWMGIDKKYQSPFYPFKKWTWKVPPNRWRAQATTCSSFAAVFAAMTVFMAWQAPNAWPAALVPFSVFVGLGSTAFRIIYRVWKFVSANKYDDQA